MQNQFDDERVVELARIHTSEKLARFLKDHLVKYSYVFDLINEDDDEEVKLGEWTYSNERTFARSCYSPTDYASD